MQFVNSKKKDLKHNYMQVFVVFTQRIMWNDGINAVSLRGGGENKLNMSENT